MFCEWLMGFLKTFEEKICWKFYTTYLFNSEKTASQVKDPICVYSSLSARTVFHVVRISILLLLIVCPNYYVLCTLRRKSHCGADIRHCTTDCAFKVLWTAQASPLLTMGQTFKKEHRYKSKAAIYCNNRANKGIHTDIHREAESFQHSILQHSPRC